LGYKPLQIQQIIPPDRSSWQALYNVSIHARARRATSADHCAVVILTFQSTPARGGRPAADEQWHAFGFVSIHARARRATFKGW